ncbi:MAG: hypothetical protein DME00_13790 [Candidatus Rokuibacteriota bacterium]|nr:MAG: hypothetical protein DME00_13790 [Candidatus Rokubacteria bacterium]
MVTKLRVYRPVVALVGIPVAAILLLAVLSTTAQVPTTVDFLVPAATPITTGLGGDEITFVSGATLTSVVGDCGIGGAFLVQGVVVVKAGTPTPATAIVTSSVDEIRPGTRLGGLSLLGKCTLGTVAYNGYRGTIR